MKTSPEPALYHETSSVDALPSGTRVSQRRRMSTRNMLLGAVGALIVMVIAQLFPLTGIISERYLPPLSTVFLALLNELADPGFWGALLATIQGWAIGLAIAMVAGTILGIIIGSVGWLKDATNTTIEFLRPIPSVAWIPLAVLLFGVGPESTLVLVVYASFWPVLLQVLYGVNDVDPVALETSHSYQFRSLSIARHVIWPTALPYIMTGFRISAAVALILEVTGELIIGSPGLGARITIAQTSNAVPSMYALVFVTGAIGVVVNIGARMLERRSLSWHASTRRDIQA